MSEKKVWCASNLSGETIIWCEGSPYRDKEAVLFVAMGRNEKRRVVQKNHHRIRRARMDSQRVWKASRSICAVGFATCGIVRLTLRVQR